MLCLSCCLIFPLPETILYDLPDSLSDLQSMSRTLGNEKTNEMTPHSTHYHMIDSNTFTFPRPTTSTLNELSPKPILRSQQSGVGRNENVTFQTQPEIIQLHSNTPSFNGLSNPCYFASYNDTIDRYDMEQQQLDNRVRISIRGRQNNNNNNNSNIADRGEETKF